MSWNCRILLVSWRGLNKLSSVSNFDNVTRWGGHNIFYYLQHIELICSIGTLSLLWRLLPAQAPISKVAECSTRLDSSSVEKTSYFLCRFYTP